jgi:hypothetical protein
MWCNYGRVWLGAFGPTWPVGCKFCKIGCLHPVLGLARRVQMAQRSLAAGKRKRNPLLGSLARSAQKRARGAAPLVQARRSGDAREPLGLPPPFAPYAAYISSPPPPPPSALARALILSALRLHSRC